eukprot:1598604-Rhodomonas_salina.1
MSKVLRLRGLPFRATEEDIRSFFRSEAYNPEPFLNIVQIRIEMGADGRPSGEALAEFITEVEAERAMAFDKQMMGNRFSFPPWRPGALPSTLRFRCSAQQLRCLPQGVTERSHRGKRSREPGRGLPGGTGAETGTGTGTGTETGTETGTGTGTGDAAAAAIGTETGTGTGAETGTETETGSGAKARWSARGRGRRRARTGTRRRRRGCWGCRGRCQGRC